MYANGACCVCVVEGYSKEFEVNIGVYHSSVLSPILFIILLRALKREFCSEALWEDRYANDLFIIYDSLKECVMRLLIWKEAMDENGLWLNAGKTNVMTCSKGLDLLQFCGEFPCYVYDTGSVYCFLFQTYFYGMQWMIGIFAGVVANIAAIYIAVPLIHPLKLTSVYEVCFCPYTVKINVTLHHIWLHMSCH